VSIRLQLTLWHAALLTLVLAGFAALVYFTVTSQLESEVDHDIQLRALQASRELRAVTRSWPIDRVRTVDLPTSALVDTSLYVQVVSPSGEVLTGSSNLPEPLPVATNGMKLALDGQEGHDTLSFLGERLELYSAPLLLDGNIVGVLQVAAPLQRHEARLAQLTFVLGAVVLAATALAGLIGWFLATRAMRPVDRMTRTAQAIGQSADLSGRLPEPKKHDELGRLAGTFNEMLGRLELAFGTQRRFLADASHELRSPLAAIRMNAEAMLRGGDADPSEREASLRAITREADRMGRLVADLLALAHADAGQPIARRRVALDSVLVDVYQQQRRLADGVTLTLGELEQVEVDGDPDRLKQLLVNLVDNALRYTPAGGEVALDVIRRDAWALLRVTDTGSGIPAEHLSRIFERFYRVDQPRSRSAGGTGLGLAICKWITDAHGGQIEVESEPGRGSTFNVLLPIGGPVGHPVDGLAGAVPVPSV
jgi:two-component system OmpR family sensor kinase